MANFFEQFGSVDLSSPVPPPDDSDVARYIVESATKRGVPVSDALRVWSGEGRGGWQSKVRRSGRGSYGGFEDSWGPYQLYLGGGLGNQAKFDVRDPSTWKQNVDFAMDHASREGWGAWYGAPPELRRRGGYKAMRMGPSDNFFAKFDNAPEAAAPEATPAPAEQPAPEQPKAPPPHTPWGEIGDDAARNYVSKTIDAVTYLAGLPGDAVKAAQWADKALGINSEGSDTEVGFGSDEIRKALKEKIGDWSYIPQTGAGKLAGYVPYVAAGGVARGARGVAQIAGGTLGASVGSEVGGPVGEVIGLVAGGRAGIGSRVPKVNAGKEATKAYDAVKGVAIDGKDFHAFGQNLANDSVVKKALLNPTLYPKVNGVIGEIATHVPGAPKVNPMAKPGFMGAAAQKQWNPGPVTFEDFDNIRQNLVRVLMRSNDKGERRIANHVISRLDAYFDNAQLTTSGMSAAQAGAKAREARTLWKQHRKSQEIDTILEVAKDDAGRFSISGHENAIRTGFRQLSKRIARYPSVAGKYTAEEKALIHKLSRGGTVRNMMQWVAKLTPNAITAPIGVGYGAGTGDWATAATIGGVGLAGRALGGANAKMQAEKLRRLTAAGGAKIRGGSPIVGGYLEARGEE